jgi:hypothetical protein
LPTLGAKSPAKVATTTLQRFGRKAIILRRPETAGVPEPVTPGACRLPAAATRPGQRDTLIARLKTAPAPSPGTHRWRSGRMELSRNRTSPIVPPARLLPSAIPIPLPRRESVFLSADYHTECANGIYVLLTRERNLLVLRIAQHSVRHERIVQVQSLHQQHRLYRCRFGDPDSGVTKACFYQTSAIGPAGYTYCAVENAACSFSHDQTSLSPQGRGLQQFLLNSVALLAVVSIASAVLAQGDESLLLEEHISGQTTGRSATSCCAIKSLWYKAANSKTLVLAT